MYTLRVRTDPDPVAEALRGEPWVTSVKVSPPDTLQVSVTDVERAEQTFAGFLAGAGVPLISLAPEAVDLEQVFLELTR